MLVKAATRWPRDREAISNTHTHLDEWYCVWNGVLCMEWCMVYGMVYGVWYGIVE
jgi:hypothetical protein